MIKMKKVYPSLLKIITNARLAHALRIMDLSDVEDVELLKNLEEEYRIKYNRGFTMTFIPSEVSNKVAIIGFDVPPTDAQYQVHFSNNGVPYIIAQDNEI